MLKKIALPILSIVLAYNTYKMGALFLKLSPADFSMLAAIFSAIVINFMITGVFAFLGFAYPTSKLLPNSYYQIKDPKRLNVIYKWLGVEYFKYFLLKTFYRKDDSKKYFNGTKSGILLFDYNTRQSEFGHLISFVFVFLLSWVLLIYGHQLVFIWINVVNIVLNFYPIILQRKHRIVIKRLIERV